MANFNVSIPAGQLVDVAWPGIPVPNSGVTFVSVNVSVSGVVSFINVIAGSMQIRADHFGSTVATIITQNAAGLQFTDTINITVPNTTPPAATGSGLTISAPHA